MLRVTVEQISASNPQKKRVLRVMEISAAEDLSDSGDYRVVALGESPSHKHEGVVRGHARLKWGPWKLVAQAIRGLKLDLEDG
jgi:hypothetical protein